MNRPLIIWTLYRRPRDLPHVAIVARKWEVDQRGERATSEIRRFDSLDAAREEMQNMGLTCITRSPGDDPVIVESWL
jgi:hypothetical protein